MLLALAAPLGSDGVRGDDPVGAFLMNSPTLWFDFGMSQLHYAV
jgi:hypothetical protein